MSIPGSTSTLLHGHTDEASAYVVDDYPYGFKLRTSIRYWIESVKGKGDRMVSQTLNPKTGRWNKPKKSTYSPIRFLAIEDETGHVIGPAISQYAEADVLEAWRPIIIEHANEWQKWQFAHLLALRNVYDRVTFTVREDTLSDAERAAADAEIQRGINRLMRGKTAAAKSEL